MATFTPCPTNRSENRLFHADVKSSATVLDSAVSLSAAVSLLSMRGISISERVLRERARKLGAYRQIGRTIFFTPEDLQKIIEPTASRNSPDTLAETKAAPAGWRDMPFSKALAAYRDSGKDARFLDKLLLHFQETKLGDINNVSMSHASQSIYPGRAPATLRRQLYVPVSAIINFVKDHRLRAPKGGGQRTVFMTPEEVERLIQAALKQPSPFLAPLITFLIGQGARMGETLSLRGKDVNLSARYAILRDTKNKQERTITLIPRVVAALSLLPTIGNDGPVFRRFDGKEFKEKKARGGQIRNPFAYAVQSAALAREVTPHACRHTWATWYYAVKKDPLLLKKEGGWLSNEYQRYVKSAPCGLAESIVHHGWEFADR